MLSAWAPLFKWSNHCLKFDQSVISYLLMISWSHLIPWTILLWSECNHSDAACYVDQKFRHITWLFCHQYWHICNSLTTRKQVSWTWYIFVLTACIYSMKSTTYTYLSNMAFPLYCQQHNEHASHLLWRSPIDTHDVVYWYCAHIYCDVGSKGESRCRALIRIYWHLFRTQ